MSSSHCSKIGGAHLIVAVLGRRDAPTDGVEDYCTLLGRALATRGFRLEQVRVRWKEMGWLRALVRLWREGAEWRGKWVLLQYTAMSWSQRGFPLRLLIVLAILRFRSCRVAVVFHDPSGFPGDRWIDRLRRTHQQWVMRMAYQWTARAILNVPVDRVGWLPADCATAVCIPVGSNVPAVALEQGGAERKTKTVVVFGVTGGEHSQREVAQIARVVCRAAEIVPRLRLVVFGRGSKEAAAALEKAVDRGRVELSVLGLLPAVDASRVLTEADVLLFVRGPFSSQRTSGIAGIACGLPVVGYTGPHTGVPLTEAGVVLVPQDDREALVSALVSVLSDEGLSSSLRHRSLTAYDKYFSWDSIASQFVNALQL